jgi:hypothetical protein
MDHGAVVDIGVRSVGELQVHERAADGARGAVLVATENGSDAEGERSGRHATGIQGGDRRLGFDAEGLIHDRGRVGAQDQEVIQPELFLGAQAGLRFQRLGFRREREAR